MDCGGGCPSTCAVGIGCKVAADCTSGFCDGTLCVATQCEDKVQSTGELGVDCGGPCPICPVSNLGVTLHLDAADPASFPGSGSTWTDLSGGGNHAAIGTYTLSTDFGGGIEVNGSSITVPAADTWSMNPATASNTIEIWWRKGTISGHGGQMIGTYPANGGTWQIFQNAEGYSATEPTASMIWANGNTPQYWWSGSTHALDEVALMTVVQVGQQFDYYGNGAFVSSQTRASFAESGSRPMTLGCNTSGTECGKMTFFVVRWYDRALTPSEIDLNFQAQRARFGL